MKKAMYKVTFHATETLQNGKERTTLQSVYMPRKDEVTGQHITREQMELIVFRLNQDGSITKIGEKNVSPAWLADNKFLVPTDPGSLILDDPDQNAQTAAFKVGKDGMPAK